MKENAATIRDTQGTVIRRTRGVQRRRKGDEHEEDEVQEKVKEASDSVHTGEKNSMPSDAENGGGEEYRCFCRWGMPACAHERNE